MAVAEAEGNVIELAWQFGFNLGEPVALGGSLEGSGLPNRF